MKANEIEAEYVPKTQEEIAKKVILDIKETIADREEAVEEAKKKLVEVLEKDINDIKKEDGFRYNLD